MISPTAFERVAATYDETFTHTPIARLMRQAVWARMDANFRAGMRVLELGCGTGEDALYLARRGVHVTATDASAKMLSIAAQKAASAGLSGLIETRLLDMNDLLPGDEGRKTDDGRRSSVFRLPSFDGIVSNFGALNCVADLWPVARRLAEWTRPGARVLLVVMGPFCPWEIAWHLLHGQPRRAFRRWARGGTLANVGSEAVRVFYPSSGRLIKLFAPSFAHRRTSGLGILLPPPYVEPQRHEAGPERSRRGGFASSRLVALNVLDAVERQVESLFPLNRCGDHYVLELERI